MSIIAAEQAESVEESSKSKYQYEREAEGIFRHTATG
jgi:hypothetical protein